MALLSEISNSPTLAARAPDVVAAAASNFATTFYFCIPQNDVLLAYWDTVADRLFKIRNCMNIEGTVRQLPLFAPPIDPALLVRAAAMGIDLNSVVRDINAATPHYRFTHLQQKALDFCSDVRSFGGALLATLEKKDAESLALLKAGQETSILKSLQRAKEQRVSEAQNTLDGLYKAQDLVKLRHDYYSSRPFMNSYETAHMLLSGIASVAHAEIEAVLSATAVAYAIPTVTTGGAGWSSPVLLSTVTDGNKVGAAGLTAGKGLEIVVGLLRENAAMSATMGAYQQRADDRKLQADLAAQELDEVDKKIAAAQISVAIAQYDLDSHRKQVDNAAAVEDFLQSRKYTNQELYSWMAAQTSALYFQSYQMAYDLAKRAEKAFSFERGVQAADYIHFGYWDSRRNGLLAGEQLHLDLKRLEAAYLDQSKRDYEIVKRISLVLNYPMALIALKETGQCFLDLPEEFFDADYPGHFMRRVKNVSLTIPCVTGPYTSVNCTLTLLKSTVRADSKPAGSEGRYSRNQNTDDPRFADNFSAVESIATSHAQNDSGMFEVNFRDERYLPFEGAGAVSTWRIEMPPDTNAFDFETISDVILNLNYTARDGGKPLQSAARDAMHFAAWSNPISGSTPAALLRMFSLKHEFPTEWYRFLHPADTAAGHTMTFTLGMDRFPFQLRGRKIEIVQADLFLKFKDIRDQQTYGSGGVLILHIAAPDQSVPTAPGTGLVPDESLNKLPHAAIPLPSVALSGSWVIEAREADIETIAKSLQSTVGAHARLKPEIIDDLAMVMRYSIGDN